MSLSTATRPTFLSPEPISCDDYDRLSHEERKAFHNYAFEVTPDGVPEDEFSDLQFHAYDACETLEEITPCESFYPDSFPHFEDKLVRRKTDDECFQAKAIIFDSKIVFDVRGNPFRNAATALRALAAKIQAAADAIESKAVELDLEISPADRPEPAAV
jgi:hypothetical protein